MPFKEGRDCLPTRCGPTQLGEGAGLLGGGPPGAGISQDSIHFQDEGFCFLLFKGRAVRKTHGRISPKINPKFC